MAQSQAFGVIEGDAQPLPPDWRRALELLPEVWREFYEERAALIEYDGGEARATAERRAFECVLAAADDALVFPWNNESGNQRNKKCVHISDHI